MNPSSIKSIKKNLKPFKEKIKLYEQDIYKVKLKKEKFDLIILENALSTLSDPKKILKKIFPLLKKNGFIVLNYWDEVSLFSEKLRGLISYLILNNYPKKNFIQKTNLISNFFKSHYKYLEHKKSSKKNLNNIRKIEKWAQDTPMNLDLIGKNKFFKFKNIINLASQHKILFWKSSPDFNTDFLWYKNFDENQFSKNLKFNFKLNSLNFLHHKEKFGCINQYKKFDTLFKKIEKINKYIVKIVKNSNVSQKDLKYLISDIDRFKEELNIIKKGNLISKSLKEFNIFLKFYLKNPANIYYFKKFNFFKNFWGNTVINISLKKNN